MKKSEKLMLPFWIATPPSRICGRGPAGAGAAAGALACGGGAAGAEAAGAEAGFACVRLVEGAASPFSAPPAITSCRLSRPLALRITRA
ncbi:hypothetical protein D3C87_1417410 [compost metagenome]